MKTWFNFRSVSNNSWMPSNRAMQAPRSRPIPQMRFTQPPPNYRFVETNANNPCKGGTTKSKEGSRLLLKICCCDSIRHNVKWNHVLKNKSNKCKLKVCTKTILFFFCKIMYIQLGNLIKQWTFSYQSSKSPNLSIAFFSSFVNCM